MSRRCTVCDHPGREAIDKALVSGAPLGTIARDKGVSRNALRRHRDNHIPGLLERAKKATAHATRLVINAEARKDGHALDVVEQLKAINAASWESLRAARQEQDRDGVLRATDRVLKQIELEAKLLGMLQTPGVTINTNAEWIEVQAAIVVVLADYPDARRAIAKKLEEL